MFASQTSEPPVAATSDSLWKPYGHNAGHRHSWANAWRSRRYGVGLLVEGTIFGSSDAHQSFMLPSSTRACSRPRVLLVWLAKSHSVHTAVLAPFSTLPIATEHSSMRSVLTPARSCCPIMITVGHVQMLASLKPCSWFSSHNLIIQLSILHDWQQFILHILKGFFNLAHIIPVICYGGTARL